MHSHKLPKPISSDPPLIYNEIYLINIGDADLDTTWYQIETKYQHTAMVLNISGGPISAQQNHPT